METTNNNWVHEKLNTACIFKSGKTISKDIEKQSGDILYVKVGDMNLEGNEEFITTSSRFVDIETIKVNDIIPVGAVIFPKRGGAIATNKKRKIIKPTIVDLNTMAVIPTKKLSADLLYYWFFSFDLVDISNGTSIPQINNNSFENIFISYPESLAEQKQIVALLDQSFAAIDQAKANLEKNIQNAQELFQSKLNAIFSQSGEGWEEKRLGDVAEVGYGFTAKSSTDGDYRYIRITDINKNGGLIADGKKYIQSSEEISNFLLKENDLLMARTGATFAKVLLYKDLEPSVFASYLIKITFNKAQIENELYWYFTKSGYYWQQANNLASGSAQPHFNGAALKKVIFSYPKSVQEQKKLITIIKGFDDMTKNVEANYQTKLNNLEELKKSILQKAFSGELT